MVTRRFALALSAALMAQALLISAGTSPSLAGDRFITVASTTSTANSGLFDHILPIFEDATGIEVRVVAVGTGQAIRLAKNGDADVLFVHHKPSEDAFVAEGYGVERFDVMYNDFILVGPDSDPADLSETTGVGEALLAIRKARAAFASRGDDSGTHKRERALWADAGVENPAGQWYRETGSGMGATLNIASGMGAHALTDRATWLSFKNKAGMAILSEGDPALFNQYGVVAVSPDRFPHVKIEDARVFVEWLISRDGQAAIQSYALNGTQLFFPNAPGS